MKLSVLPCLLLAACASAGPSLVTGGDASLIDAPRQGSDAAIDAPSGQDGPAIDGPPVDSSGPPGSHLVINEIDYDQVGTDNAEYIEIFNPTAASISLVNVSVMLVNGANNAVYDTIDLSPKSALPAGGYLVIGNAAVIPAGGALKITPSSWASNAIQNGNPDGIALVDTSAHSLIDALSYGGPITTATLTGFPSAVSLVEGTALDVSVVDSATTTGALCRKPNGTDTDNANADWKFCTTLSAGAANP